MSQIPGFIVIFWVSEIYIFSRISKVYCFSEKGKNGKLDKLRREENNESERRMNNNIYGFQSNSNLLIRL